jgi:dihydroorotate dehydrogenase
MYQRFGDRIRIIGMGGISSAEEAYEKICAGASLVQLVTGLVYEGPSINRRINKGLVKYLKRDGFTTIKEAVGSAHS